MKSERVRCKRSVLSQKRVGFKTGDERCLKNRWFSETAAGYAGTGVVREHIASQ
jgi:hypothetical protein